MSINEIKLKVLANKYFHIVKNETAYPFAIFLLVLLTQILIIKKQYFLLFVICGSFSLFFIITKRIKTILPIFIVTILMFWWIVQIERQEKFQNYVIRTFIDHGELTFSGKRYKQLAAFDKGRFSINLFGRISDVSEFYQIKVIFPELVGWIEEIDNCKTSFRCVFYDDAFRGNYDLLDKVRHFSQNIDGSFYINGISQDSICSCISELEQNSKENIKNQSIQFRILNLIENSNSEKHKQGVAILLGAVMGVGTHTPLWVSDLFRSIGLYHLLVVSGYHLGVVFLFSKFFVKKILKFRPELLKFHHEKFYSILISAPLILIFVLMNESMLPLWRALLAYLIASLITLGGQKISNIRLLVLTLILINIIWPLCILLPGVQLTFAALSGVLLGLYFSELLEKPKKMLVGLDVPEDRHVKFFYSLVGIALPSLLAIIFVTPFQLYWFGTFSPLGLFFNLIFSYPFSLLAVGIGIFTFTAFYFGLPFSEEILLFHGYLISMLIDLIFDINQWIVK